VDADGTYTDGTYVGAPATWANMNSDDDDTTHYNATGVDSRSWSFSAAQNYTTNSITIYHKTKNILASANTVYRYVRIAGTDYGAPGLVLSASAPYTLYSYTWTTNPATGTAWTKAVIDAAEFGIREVGTSHDHTTLVYLVQDYTSTPPSVTTSTASDLAPTTTTLNGAVTDDAGVTIDYYGFVWDTTDKGDGGNNDPAGPPGTWTNGWKSAVGDYGENTFSHSATGLTKGTEYYYRAAAHNSNGWAYGSAVSFTTIDDPTITTVAASQIATTTARLNALVTFDGEIGGGEDCTVTFVYKSGSPYANYAAVLAAGGTEVAAAGTYNVNESPYYDVAGLVASTTYSVAVKVVNSTTTVAYGSVLTFITSNGISDPTDLKAISTATTISLVWTKNTGANYTLVRYSASAQPVTTADGTVGYLGTGNSVVITGLTPGITYFISAWGKTALLYSAGYDEAISTTLAYDTGASTGTLETPPTNSWWNQTPSTTKVGNIPVVSALVSQNATVYAIPEASLWYFLWVLFSVGLGVIIYVKSSMNLVAGLGSQALLFALGAVLGLTMLWIMVVFMIIGTGLTLWGNRH